jgi:hypothetical protein
MNPPFYDLAQELPASQEEQAKSFIGSDIIALPKYNHRQK